MSIYFTIKFHSLYMPYIPLMHHISHTYSRGLPCHPPGNLPDPGIESSVLTDGFFTTSATWETLYLIQYVQNSFSKCH